MKLLLIRHGEAQNKADFAHLCDDDALRPLTRRGRRRMKRAAKGLSNTLAQIDILASSPLTRARQTAKLVTTAYDKLKPVEIAALAPGKKPPLLLKWLTQQDENATIALVGHEPDLGIQTGWLMSGLDEALVRFKKGGACLLECDGRAAPGHCRMIWLMEPGQLRRMG
jgi:phosphohistidine phosphatase